MPILAVNICWNKCVTFDNNKNYAQFKWGHTSNDEWIQPNARRTLWQHVPRLVYLVFNISYNWVQKNTHSIVQQTQMFCLALTVPNIHPPHKHTKVLGTADTYHSTHYVCTVIMPWVTDCKINREMKWWFLNQTNSHGDGENYLMKRLYKETFCKEPKWSDSDPSLPQVAGCRVQRERLYLIDRCLTHWQLAQTTTIEYIDNFDRSSWGTILRATDFWPRMAGRRRLNPIDRYLSHWQASPTWG